ncbi:hypothetical protein GWI33_017057 [Rhynchophorus ferrugineus]|uniref:Uncharacterized protein n=1 Tax=Rhynchophorus ferrugineus TaxID=354439 RepID=A0A834M9P6_RHYFE|nr:hypothetical protein GWI33_017057 [Rhynchophorus ferrugineus]
MRTRRECGPQSGENMAGGFHGLVRLTVVGSLSTFHTAHHRIGRARLERDREYDEYSEKDHLSVHHLPADEYRDRPMDRVPPPRDLRNRDDLEYPAPAPHKSSSRKALNAI